MAAENTLVIQFEVGRAVAARIEEFRQARSLIQGIAERNYQTQADTEGWSYEQRLAFRKAMLAKEQAKGFPDQDYIRDVLQKDVADLTKLNRTFQVGQRIQKDLGQVLSGHETWNDHLDFLQKQLSNTDDPELRNTIQQEITRADQEIFTNEKNIIDSQIQLAESGHNIPILQDMMDKVKVEQAKYAATNPEFAAALGVKLQTLNNDISNEQIGIFKTQLSIVRARKGSALNYLNELSGHVNESDAAQSVVYQGVQYKSLQDFWNIERDKYIDSTFMDDLTKEYTNYVNRIVTANGIVPIAALDSIQNEFKILESKPEMQEFINRLEIARTGIVGDAIDKSAKAIIGNYDTNENAPIALSQLQELQDKYGINTAQYSQNIIQKYAKTKEAQTGAILNHLMSYVGEGQSYQQAFSSTQKDIAAGKLVLPNVSPEEAARKTPEQIAAEAPEKTKEQLKEVVPNVPEVKGNQPNLPTTPGQAGGLTPKPAEQNGGIFNPSDHIGQRPSKVNPTVTELFNVKTGQGYANPQEVYKDFIGKRASAVNPSVNEYFNAKTGQGFANEKELFSFANSLGAGKVSSFNELGI